MIVYTVCRIYYMSRFIYKCFRFLLISMKNKTETQTKWTFKKKWNRVTMLWNFRCLSGRLTGGVFRVMIFRPIISNHSDEMTILSISFLLRATVFFSSLVCLMTSFSLRRDILIRWTNPFPYSACVSVLIFATSFYYSFLILVF